MRGLLSGKVAAEASRRVAICPTEVFYPAPNSMRVESAAARRATACPASLAVHHWCCTWGDLDGGIVPSHACGPKNTAMIQKAVLAMCPTPPNSEQDLKH
eukprot:4959022-Amphidinium_carterae.1